MDSSDSVHRQVLNVSDPETSQIERITNIVNGTIIYDNQGSIMNSVVDELLEQFEAKHNDNPDYIKPMILLYWIKSNNYSLANPKQLCQNIMNKLNPSTNYFCSQEPVNAEAINQAINDDSKSFLDAFDLFTIDELNFFGY